MCNMLDKALKETSKLKQFLEETLTLRHSLLDDYLNKLEKDILILTGASLIDTSLSDNIKIISNYKNDIKCSFYEMLGVVNDELDPVKLTTIYSNLLDDVEKFYDAFDEIATKIKYKNLTITDNDVTLTKLKDLATWSIIHSLMKDAIMKILPYKEDYMKIRKDGDNLLCIFSELSDCYCLI